MKTVYFIRHGLSDANVAGLVSGGEHEAILTEEGRQQAINVGKKLQGKSIDTVVCSPMKRTLETAQLIASQLGISLDSIKTNRDFIEILMGYYSGRLHTEYRQDINAGKAHPSLEPSEVLHTRVKRGLEWVRGLEGQNIVLVSHGATGRMVKVIDQGLHHSDMYKVDGFANTEIYQFTL